MQTFHRVLAAFGVLIFALTALPQTSEEAITRHNAASARARAYTVEFTITNIQTLYDGTKITRESKEIESRDSQNRWRREITENWPGQKDPVTRVDVRDPVESTQISWDSQRRVANVVKLPPPDQRTGCWSNDAGNYSVNYGNRRPPNVASATGTTGMTLSSGGAAAV